MIGLLIVLSLPVMGLIQSFQQQKEVKSFSKEEQIYEQYPNFAEEVKTYYEEKNRADIVDPFTESSETTEITEVISVDTSEGKYTHDLINGSVGHIEMPSINEKKLPLYIGASKENLSKGIAQVTGTDLPNSGLGNHSVISGHRGYYGSNFFMYIDYLDIGDIFYVTYLNETAAYEVTGNEIIEATDVEKLIVKPNQDEEWLTLLTCHPLPSLEKRLLVHSKRVPMDESINQTTIKTKTTNNQVNQRKAIEESENQKVSSSKVSDNSTALREVTPSQPVVVFVSKALQHSRLFYIVVLSIGVLLFLYLIYKFIRTF